MKNYINKSIEYIGLEDMPNVLYKNFSELTLDYHLVLLENKPGIKSIISANLDFSLKNNKIVKTIKGCSLDGIVLTGHKLIIHGILKEKIQYVDDSPKSAVHNIKFNLPFSSFLILPKNIYEDIDLSQINIYIQHISTKIKDDHTLYQNINTLICY